MAQISGISACRWTPCLGSHFPYTPPAWRLLAAEILRPDPARRNSSHRLFAAGFARSETHPRLPRVKVTGRLHRCLHPMSGRWKIPDRSHHSPTDQELTAWRKPLLHDHRQSGNHDAVHNDSIGLKTCWRYTPEFAPSVPSSPLYTLFEHATAFAPPLYDSEYRCRLSSTGEGKH